MLDKIENWTKTFTDVVKKKDIEKGYVKPPSIFDQMGLVDWNDEHHMGLLSDGISLVRFLELRDISAETMEKEELIELYEKLQKMLSTIVPLEDVNPWVVSIYCQDDLTLNGLKNRLNQYIDPKVRDKKVTQKFIEVMDDHFRLLSQEEGLFTDKISGLAFRGRSRRLRLVLYRKYTKQISGSHTKNKLFERIF